MITTLMAAACMATTTTWAEDYNHRPSYARGPIEYGLPFIQHHASTFEEGFLRGRADLIRSWGYYLYARSLALINNEEARRRYIDNYQRGVDAYFTVRELNRQARAAERGERPTREDLIRFSKARAPKPLAPHQFNPALRTLHWPTALQGQQFSAERTAIDQLIRDRSVHNSGLGSHNCQQIRRLTELVTERLKSQVHTISPSDYVAAKQFLYRLSREAQQTVDFEGLAIR
jgi:hypothetical protein